MHNASNVVSKSTSITEMMPKTEQLRDKFTVDLNDPPGSSFDPVITHVGCIEIIVYTPRLCVGYLRSAN